ncbi:MAG TPA: CDP-alcohol phosphatidyltransferase family protein [Saprospiraceae bacterium]|nr:CDP-alcohol phosphatidyltransferase family protein [Saprospiraceae bacterium]
MNKFAPTTITSLNLLLGFLGILLGQVQLAGVIILACVILDGLDGRIARTLNVQSEIGKQMDSLADLISFGAMPSYIYFLISPVEGYIAYFFPSLIVLASALRLAKFNTLPDTSGHFQGLPTPATAMFLAGLFFGHSAHLEMVEYWVSDPFIYSMIAVILAALMICPVTMISLKKGMKKKTDRMIIVFLLITFFLSVWLLRNGFALSIMIGTYIILSCSRYMIKKRRSS